MSDENVNAKKNLFERSDSEFRECIRVRAHEYAERGWFVFPLHSVHKDGLCTCGVNPCKDAGKHPRVRRGVNEASRDPAKIEEWFGKGSELSNIGIATGLVSGITVIDIDTAEGKLGAQSWTEAIEGHGEPDTLMARTGSGGMHVIFAYSSALKTASNVLGKGVDCRNDGGYIVAAPSRHKSGGTYEWLNEGTPLAHLPAHLSMRKETRGRKKKDDPLNQKYTLEQVQGMLDVVPADDRDMWRNVGIILGREFKRIDEAWQLYNEWAAKGTNAGKKGRGHDDIMHDCFYVQSQQDGEKQLSLGTIVKAAMDNGWVPKKGEVPIDDFIFYGPGNNYIYRRVPKGKHWEAAAVDSVVSPVNVDGKIIKASDWLKQNRLVTTITKDPGIKTDFLKGFNFVDGEISEDCGAAIYNSYRHPRVVDGDPSKVEIVMKHARAVLPGSGDTDQFWDYMAHCVQFPEVKRRFALLLGGNQGVGKDFLVECCIKAIGVWNVANIEPEAFEQGFNEYAAATLVRINEAANLHEMSKWAFNERTKRLICGRPDDVDINPKYGVKYSMRMFCGVIVTTNHLASGIYIPEGDRRYDVLESETLEGMGFKNEQDRKEYFEPLWAWLDNGGEAHMAAWLRQRDLKNFNPNQPRETQAKKNVIAEGMSPDEWLADIIDDLSVKNKEGELVAPIGIRADTIITKAVANGEKEGDVVRRLSTAIGRAGYVKFPSPADKAGRWRIGEKRVKVYVKAGTPATFNPQVALKTELF